MANRRGIMVNRRRFIAMDIFILIAQILITLFGVQIVLFKQIKAVLFAFTRFKFLKLYFSIPSLLETL